MALTAFWIFNLMLICTFFAVGVNLTYGNFDEDE